VAVDVEVGGHVRYAWISTTLLSSMDALPTRIRTLAKCVRTIMERKNETRGEREKRRREEQKQTRGVSSGAHGGHGGPASESEVREAREAREASEWRSPPRTMTVETLPFYLRMLQRCVLVAFHRIDVLVRERHENEKNDEEDDEEGSGGEEEPFCESPYELFEQCSHLVLTLLDVRVLDGEDTLEM